MHVSCETEVVAIMNDLLAISNDDYMMQPNAVI